MADIALIGIGNPNRGDDGAGWAVIDRLENRVEGVALYKLRGEISELLDIFSKYPTVYCIDACVIDAPAGFWERLDANLQPVLLDNPQTSTHGLGLSQAIALARTLDQMPSKLIIYAIKGENYSVSAEASFPVTQSIDVVAEKILDEEDIRACMKKA